MVTRPATSTISTSTSSTTTRRSTTRVPAVGSCSQPPAISGGTRGSTPGRPLTSAPLKTAPSPHAGRLTSKRCLAMFGFYWKPIYPLSALLYCLLAMSHVGTFFEYCIPPGIVKHRLHVCAGRTHSGSTSEPTPASRRGRSFPARAVANCSAVTRSPPDI